MSESAPAGSVSLRARADERMTAEREEIKYLVPSARVPALLTELSRHLPAHRFTGDGANRLPFAHHFVTTIYFDTPTRRNYRASIGDVEHNVKVRAKEYYDVHPSLAEIATDASQIVRYQPWMWFELKRRDGARTMKRRFRLPKRAVPDFFSGGQLVTSALVTAEDATSVPLQEELQEVVHFCRSLGEPLAASCVVNYRRMPFQDDEGALRVTLDFGLAYYAPPADLWTRTRALVRSTLGQPKGSMNGAVLEVKRRAALPLWLLSALADARVEPVQFSKFVAASEVVDVAP